MCATGSRSAGELFPFFLLFLCLSLQHSECVLQEVEVLENGPLMAKLKWTLRISEVSTLVQEIELSAVSPYLTFRCHVNWHENHKCLKVAFDTTLTTRIASFETQFGYIDRPTHTNTSWDSAKFEVCGHKYVCSYCFLIIIMNSLYCSTAGHRLYRPMEIPLVQWRCESGEKDPCSA